VRDELLLYYERELTFLRQMGVEFADKYPKIASRLSLEPDKCEDPHVERLLEAFAFLAARVHLKIDDEFPEITEALLSIIYPHFIRPVPSMTIADFRVNPEQGQIGGGLKIPRGSMLSSRPVGGVPCKFRTCYDTYVWPLSVVAAEWKTPDRLQPAIKAPEAAAALRVELKCWPDITFEKLRPNPLRLFLNGESGLIHTLYELLCSRCTEILVRDPTPGSRVRPVHLRPDALRPVGFAEDEGMLPYPRRSFTGYRLLHEYFTFPDKFFFLDLTGLETALAGGFKDRAELIFLIAPFELADRRQALELGVTEKTFQTACAPAVNLFERFAEPIRLSHTLSEYRVIPDVMFPGATEVYSVDRVTSNALYAEEPIEYRPLYSFRHGERAEQQQAFWLANRRPSERKGDAGTEVYLSLLDLNFSPARPPVESLTVSLTCTNRDLPERLPLTRAFGDIEMEAGAILRIRFLDPPSPTIRPPMRRGLQWRLASHLSLNHLSVVEEGLEALREILKLYDFSGNPTVAQQIAGLRGVRSRPKVARMDSEHGLVFSTGLHVDLQFDEEQYVGSGVYLLASVLERFFALSGGKSFG